MHNSGSGAGNSQQSPDTRDPESFPFQSTRLGSFASSLPDHWLPNKSAEEPRELNPIAAYLQAQVRTLLNTTCTAYERSQDLQAPAVSPQPSLQKER